MTSYNYLDAAPSTAHGALVLQMLDNTDLLTRMGELDEAAHSLLIARIGAFACKRAADEAKAQQEQAWNTCLLDPEYSHLTVDKRAATVALDIRDHPDYPQWQQCKADAAQAQHDAEAAETRWRTARAILDAAAAAVGALGGGA